MNLPASTPDFSRLHQFFSRLEAGDALKIGVVGGSFTTAYATEAPLADGWMAQMGRWWHTQTAWPGSQVQVINRGVSGTDSATACLRINEHVHETDMDLVILELVAQ